jgi:hypothetical protein
MIQREELDRILSFVASRWNTTVEEPNNKAMEGLPNDFWMNSIGGKTAKGGFLGLQQLCILKMKLTQQDLRIL